MAGEQTLFKMTDEQALFEMADEQTLFEMADEISRDPAAIQELTVSFWDAANPLFQVRIYTYRNITTPPSLWSISSRTWIVEVVYQLASLTNPTIHQTSIPQCSIL